MYIYIFFLLSVHKLILVCPQTFSHTVMCKVCLTDSNTVFSADAVFWQNHWIWRVRFLVYRLIKLAEHVLLNSPYNPLTIELAGFSAKSWTRKYKPDFWLNLEQGNWGWRVVSTRQPQFPCSRFSQKSGLYFLVQDLSLIHIWRCRRYSLCRSRWSPYH